MQNTVLSTWMLCVLCLLLIAFYFLSNWLRILPLMLRLPGPPALPLIGNAHLITDSKKLIFIGRNAYDLYGPLARIWVSFLPMVLVNDPKYVQAVLSSSKNTDKAQFYKLLHNFLGQGLLTSNGDQWRDHRRAIQPAFHVSFMEQFIPKFVVGSELLLDKLHHKPHPRVLNITTLINDTVLGILKDSVLGIPMQKSTSKDDQSPYRKGQVTAQYRISHPWLLLNWIYEKTDNAKRELHQKSELYDFTKKVVTARREERQRKSSDIKRTEDSNSTSFLDFMIGCEEETQSMTENDVIHELCTFMLAGQDSVGAALAFCLHLLAKNPAIQEEVLRELNSIFQDSSRHPTAQDLKDMKLLERCIKEGLRMYPSVPLIARRTKEDLQMGDVTLPAGCEVVISPFILHHLPQVWKNPREFDPDRFLPENSADRHPFAYIPFSAGPRNCIGNKFSLLEMKTIISTILRKYQLDTVPGKEKLKILYRVTLRASGGIWLKFTPR